MGYDMTTEQPADPAEAAAVAAAYAKTRTLTSPSTLPEGPERDAAEKAWRDAWAAYDAAQLSYFRLNIWGMSRCADTMSALGMLTGEPHPSWPQLDAYGLDDYPDDPEDYEGEERAEKTRQLTPSGRKYLDDAQAVVDYEPQPVNGIPAHKFGSNDGWLVTPSQCAAALAVWEKTPAEQRAAVEARHEWWPRWVAFLAHSKDRGGFRVF
jgi:hypothetical protein